MTLHEFLDNKKRKYLKTSKESNFYELLEFYKSTSFSIDQNNSQIIINSKKESINFDDYLDKYLPKNIEYIHQQLYNYIYSNNKFIDGLPLYIIRRHGAYSGESGSIKRRRGWLVRFNNAWILYADNFVSRHFFELSYFINKDFNKDLKESVNSFIFPFSTGGGKYEKLNRFFPTLTHLSSTSNLYLSHLYDLNKGTYLINEIQTDKSIFLGTNEGKFGHGNIEDWNIIQTDDKKIRTFDEYLSPNEIEFLKKYNLRMLSPLNFFPFPKKSKMKNSNIDGESQIIRDYYRNYLQRNFVDLDIAKTFV